jgi:cAMP-binding proteins - catabolite gene activator and regulatory subunit of cAMP-dependent protein kinases
VATKPVRPDVYAAFRGSRLWRTASDEAVRRLAEIASVSDVPRGTPLATEGEPAERFGVLVAGRARVFHLQADGRTITLEALEAGDPLAAVAALAGGRYPANVDATTPATIAWLARDALFDLIETEPAVARSLIADLATRVVNLTSVVQTLALDVPGRLARYLFQRSLAAGTPTAEGLVVSLGMTKTELAAALGTVPETLSRAFGRLRDDDVLIVRGTDVVVLDVGALARLGSGYEEA